VNAEPRRSYIAALGSLGPGLVFALAVVGMGDFVTNASLGALYGYSFLWLLVLGVAFRFTWLDTSARYALATGEGLVEGLARLGRPLVLTLFALAPILGHILNLARIVLFAQIAQLLAPLPFSHGAVVYGVAFDIVVLVAILRGGYAWLEKFSKWLICGLTIGLAGAALVSHPDPLGILRGLIPSVPPTIHVRSTLLMVTALIGTEAGSLTNITYASFLRAKGWRDRSALRLQRRDLVLSVSAMFLVGVLTQIAAANTMLGSGVPLKTASDLVHVIAGKVGPIGVWLVAVGLSAKVFSSTVGGSTGYALIITELGRRYVPGLRHADRAETLAADGERDPLFKWTAVFLCISPLYGLMTTWTPVTLVLLSQAATVVLIPVLSLGLVRLTRQRDRMGVIASGVVRTTVMLLMTAVSLWILWRNLAAWTGPLLQSVAASRLAL
jgi:Mn2+/Fe2+ NRAMP family transporter